MSKARGPLIIDNADDLTSDYKAQMQNNLSYDQGFHEREQKRFDTIGTRVFAVLASGFFLVLIWLLWQISELLKDRYSYDSNYHDLVDTSVNVLIIAGVIVLLTWLVVMLVLFWNKALLAGVVRLPGGMPAYIQDIARGWNRAAPRALAESSMAQHFKVQGDLARNPGKSMTYYAPTISRSSHLSGTTDNAEKAPSSFPVVPSMADLLGSGFDAALLSAADEAEEDSDE